MQLAANTPRALLIVALVAMLTCGCRRSKAESKPCTLPNGSYPAAIESVNIAHPQIARVTGRLAEFARQQSRGGAHSSLSPTEHQACREVWTSPSAPRFELTALHYTHLGPAIHTVIYEASAKQGAWHAELVVRFEDDNAEKNYFELKLERPGSIL